MNVNILHTLSQLHQIDQMVQTMNNSSVQHAKTQGLIGRGGGQSLLVFSSVQFIAT